MNERSDKRPRTAVALEYDGSGAPRVTAKGDFLVAEKILELAREHGIPMYSDAELVRLLARVELGDEIPANLYRAVAEVIAFAYQVSGKQPPSSTRDAGRGTRDEG